jgi:predicted Zn-ribbon and HTH transcriptional regulator
LILRGSEAISPGKRRPPNLELPHISPIKVKSFHRHIVGEVMMVCSVGGPMDIDYKERVKGKDYKCRSCGEKFKGVGKHPICPSCQSDDVAAE